MRKFFYILLLLFVSALAQAQMNCTFTHYSQENGLSENSVMDMVQDHDGMIWFATWDGINRFNGYDFKVYKARKENDMRWSSNRVDHLQVDKYGDVWCITYDGKAFRFDKRMEAFTEVAANGAEKDLVITSILPLDNGTVWLLTDKNGGIRVVPDRKTGTLASKVYLSTASKEKGTAIKTVFLDKKNREWLLTKDGLLCIEGNNGKQTPFFVNTHPESGRPNQSFFSAAFVNGHVYFTSNKGRVWKYSLKDETFELKDLDLQDDVISIRELSGGKVIMATRRSGFVVGDAALESLKYYGLKNEFDFSQHPIRSIYVDSHNEVWFEVNKIGTVCHFNPSTEVFKVEQVPVEKEPGDAPKFAVCEDKQGNLWVHPVVGGLNELKSLDKKGNALFTSYSAKDGLPTDVLSSLAEDTKGDIWIGSESGLSKMDIVNHHFDNYLKQEIGEELSFEESTAIRAEDGRLLFGTNRGLLCFTPELIRKNSYVPGIVLSGLKIANKDVVPRPESVLPESLNSLSHLYLSHRENTVTLSFAALDMSFPENVKYAYMLDGFDKEWNYVGKQRTATYTNLPKGNYVFRVKSTNGAGIWVENERALRITVKPSFWETPYAYVIYTLGFMLILLVGAYTLFVIYRLKHEVSVEQQVTDMKLRFFTNISHELRTPLTLIEGPLEYILKRSDLSKDVREQLQVVERNTHRMLRLVNQILDFRKIQNHKMKLCIEQIDIVAFVHKIMENFESIAESNKIDFIFETEQPKLKLWVDADKVEKIVFNLLSNAFKYTQPGKTITVFIHENEDTVTVGVQDQGIGISENKKASLFVRFETLLDKNLFNPNSSGIGLSLVKELVEMHHASIHVDSKEGEGSCFSVDFLKGKDHYGENAEFVLSDNVEIIGEASKHSLPVDVETPAVAVPEDKPEAVPAADEADKASVSETKTMLLIEDNLELRFFLRSIFSQRFRIIEAANGVEGLEKAIKYVPDIIISDIMMPEKDGITLVKELREELTTSHIPIVLLTAKTDMDTKLQSLELGADSYITKPFSATYLEARVDNLLARRQKLRQFYCDHLMDINPPKVENEEEEVDVMSQQDRRFLEQLTNFMERNIDNGELVVDDLVHEMAVSRSVFFKKLKSLTGLAPIEFIKEMRVKRAAQLIETGEFNMTQISYMVGINDPRYFSKCFKQRFGMTPTEYREKQKNK